jgi:hypothetical protein
MRHLVCSVRYSVAPVNSSLLTTALHSSVTTLVYNDTKYSVPFVTFEPSSTVVCQVGEIWTLQYLRCVSRNWVKIEILY